MNQIVETIDSSEAVTDGHSQIEPEQVDRFVLVHSTEPGVLGFVEVNRQVGRVFFTPKVHVSVIPFVAKIVEQLGIQDTPLVIARGSYAVPEESGSNLGVAFPKDEVTSTGVLYYSQRLELKDTLGIALGDETIYVNAVKAILIHELVQIAFREKERKLVKDTIRALMLLHLVAPGDYELTAQHAVGDLDEEQVLTGTVSS